MYWRVLGRQQRSWAGSKAGTHWRNSSLLLFCSQEPTLLQELLRRRIEEQDPRDMEAILRVCSQFNWQLHLGPLPQLAKPRCAQGC